jgi:FkbM family methyltransferase
VTAFEPVPESQQRLLVNLAKNEVRNVTIERVALSDEAGTARMSVHANAHGCDQIGTADADAAGDHGDVALIEVETTTGDRYAEESGEPDVI